MSRARLLQPPSASEPHGLHCDFFFGAVAIHHIYPHQCIRVGFVSLFARGFGSHHSAACFFLIFSGLLQYIYKVLPILLGQTVGRLCAEQIVGVLAFEEVGVCFVNDFDGRGLGLGFALLV